MASISPLPTPIATRSITLQGLRVPVSMGVEPTTIPGFQYLSYGDSDYDARHRFATSYNYEVPIFSSWHDNLALREGLSGWHISGVTALPDRIPGDDCGRGCYSIVVL